MDSKCMEIPALGRSLYPGMLYDCRRDSFIPGVTLWDAEAVNKHIDVHQQPKTQLTFTSSDTLSEKAKLLDISASLKASFFSGLVEVGGSAKYLNDTKSSTRQSRVTMQYSQTTEFRQLTMKELGNITYPQVFDQKTATHVVTAVLYGAQAFMVFDYTAAENESKQAVEGNLYAVVKKIPTISIEGDASLKMTDEEKKMAENTSVTFYGDVALEENPTTFKEALEVYKTLPTLMKKENYNGVPLTVWLYPLMLLDDKAARLVREISMNLLNKTENLMEEFGEVERRCNDLFKNQMTDDFSDVKDRLLKFGDLHSCYKTTFQKALSRVLPAIRGGTQEGKALEDILNFHDTSPFNARNVNKWLDNITTELNILSSYTSGLKNLTVVNSQATLNSILFDPENDVVVCLSFTSLKYEDSYLAALQDFESSEGFAKFEQTSERIFSCEVPQPWFTSPDISESMRQNLSLFTSFSKANKNEKGLKFIIASISDPSNPGNSIQLYQKGRLTDPKFQPVSKPPLPVVETSDEKVILKLSKSPTGKTVQFRVEDRMTPPTDSAEDADEWTVTDTSDAQPSFTLTGLKPANQYWVRYRAVSDVGVSEASDSVSFTFHGNLEVTVNQWSIPYIGTIPGGLKAEMALYFQGVVFATGKVFNINLQIKPHDVAFHLKFSIGDSVVRNSFRNGKWENEERTSGCPVSEGSAFDIFVVTKAEGYEVYINGQWFCQFNHRMPIERVTELHISGDIILNTTGIVGNWSTSTFGKELNSGVSHKKSSRIQSDVPHPVCSPSKPYLGPIPGGLRPGVALFFQGVVPSDCNRFEINLQTGLKYLHDIALHFNPRMHSVVLNSCRNGTWENYIETPGGPFVKGGAFDIIMVIKPEGYEVIVNGLGFCTFNHRFPLDKVTTLDIRGDVFMNTFGIIEVDDVKLKFTVPANI
ncbi:verrucotoxin subunit beta-like [Neoarius graeffei]|uniref:verrucotoxin subunit beta-like n=1 Tax=Neoarius graeffei TaxID=443677 RepID=UPI00298CFF33|nr:verrucotoxin subunit beta-like [Neoarius graeffei]